MKQKLPAIEASLSFQGLTHLSGVTKLSSLPMSKKNTCCLGDGENVGCVSKESKKSPTGPTEGTPAPENLVALATYLGVRW